MSNNGTFYFTSKKVGKAIWDYKMLKEGDKVLVAVSGGRTASHSLKFSRNGLNSCPSITRLWHVLLIWVSNG